MGILVLDMPDLEDVGSTRIAEANSAAALLLKKSRESLVGKELSVIRDFGDGEILEQLRRALCSATKSLW